MTYENILFEKDGAVGILKINRPKSLNALNPPTVREIAACLEEVRQDQSIRCLIITGGGDRAFVAGADISAMVSMNALEGKAFSALGLNTLRVLEELPIPVIAAVNGFALGGGTELALACDLIIAADKARFGQPEINLGVIPGFGGTQRLARRIGHNKARELIMTGEMFDAKTALDWGLANQVVAPGELIDTARKLAEKLTAKSAIALRQAKAALRAAFTMNEDAGLRFEQEAFGVVFGSADRVEGTAAFVEKRPPAWQHK